MKHIYLGTLIEWLEEQDQNKVVPMGFGAPHSFRGKSKDVAFEPESDISYGDMLNHAKSALKTTYKSLWGGQHTMTEITDCWIAEKDSSAGQMIGWTLLQYFDKTAYTGNVFRVGNNAKWTSTAAGTTKTKIGEVIHVVKPGEDPRDFIRKFRRTNKFKNRLGEGVSRDHVSYLVYVKGSRNTLYWPLVSKLEKVDE